MSVLSKKLLINSSIEDHINKRLARIIQSPNYLSLNGKQTSSSLSFKSKSSRNEPPNTDSDSNDEVSDEGLDMSQRIGDNLNNLECASDDNLIESSVKLQSSIEKILNMFEDTSKQLAESHSLQIQLANKLEENQKLLNDYKVRYQNLESDHVEIVEDFRNKLANYEGKIIEEKLKKIILN